MNGPSVFGTPARLSKLRAMSAGEILARIRYRLVLDRERRQHRRGALILNPEQFGGALRRDLAGAGWQGRLLDARQSSRSRFLSGAHERDRMRALFEARYRVELEDTARHAARAREHRFEFFGRDYTYPREIDWQADPATGKRWPSLFHADVPIHGGDVGYGDVKHVWELSRQQYVVDLAKSFFLAGDGDDLRAMRHLVTSWIAGNPYATGVNWSCALEPAFRAWSWLWAYHLTADALDEAFHIEWLSAFHNHGRFLFRHLEEYSSPYNHLIGEAAALYALGHAFPEFRSAPEWRRLGRGVLEARLREQFYADGGSAEQSAFYHHATAGFYLLAALVGRANGDELSRDVWSAMDRAIEFSMRLMEPDGRTPEIGGADDGKPIRMEHLPFWDFRPYQAIGAVLFSRPDFKHAAGRFYEDALWLLGPSGLDRFDALPAKPPCERAILLRSSGYAIDRSDWSASADYVCFDIGEQAAGMRHDGVPNSMHGHADCLSVIVSLGGRRVLVDSGLYGYNCGGAWEAHFRETAAHSTARIDGRDQARHIGKMAWSHSYRATIEAFHADDRQSWTIGSHDGYARGPDGLVHRRIVWRRPGGYVLVYDEFVGAGRHDLEVNFQLAPGELTSRGANRMVFDGFAELLWVGTGEWSPATRCGGPEPSDGWISPSLGVRVAAPRLTLMHRTQRRRTGLLTVFARGADSAAAVTTMYGIAGTTLLAVGAEEFTDWIAAADFLQERSAIESDAKIAVCRMAGGREVERAAIGGTVHAVNGEALLRLQRVPGHAHR